MLKRIIFWVCLSITSLSFADTADNTSEYHFSNGLKLIVKEDHRAPMVISEVWYKVGSSYEPLGITGISHMLEHMMFKGTEKYSRDKLTEVVSAVGGKMNAFTSLDYTGYYLKLPASELELALDIESDRMRNLLFDEQEFLKERDVVAEERRLRTDNVPSSDLYEKISATALPGSPYHHPVIGWMQDIQAYKLQDAKDWYQKYYAPNNAVLVIVGNVNPDNVYELTKKYFGKLKPSNIPSFNVKKTVPVNAKRFLSMHKNNVNPELQMMFNVPSVNSSETDWEPYALELLSDILSGGNASRLNRDLVRTKKLASTVYSSYHELAIHDSFMFFRALPTRGTSLEVLKQGILDDLNNLKQNLVTDKELDRAKRNVIASSVYEKDSMYMQAQIIGTFESIGLKWLDAENYVDNIQDITKEQIQEVAKKYLKEECLTVAYLKPTKSAEEK